MPHTKHCTYTICTIVPKHTPNQSCERLIVCTTIAGNDIGLYDVSVYNRNIDWLGKVGHFLVHGHGSMEAFSNTTPLTLLYTAPI